MRFIKLFTITIAIALFITACNSTQTDDAAVSPTYPNDAPQIVNDDNIDTNDDYYARENLDLQAVGDIFKESNSAEDFERRLNSDDGVNNIDLNGDGYADYISVNEYQDRDTGYRGFSLLDNFGGDAIQEVATIILDRTLNDGRGSRLYIDGNDQIYGNDYVYRADWKDTSLDIVNWAFGNRDQVYQSPYYYDNYPDNYNAYEVIETPVYRTRIQEYYTAPVFVKTDYNEIRNIRIQSPYKDKYYDKIYAKLANPKDSQKEFRKKNRKPDFVRNNRVNGKNVPPGLSKKAEKEDRKAEKEYRKEIKKEIKEERKNNSFEDKSDKRERKENKSGKKEKRGQNFKMNDGGKKDRDKGNVKNKGGKGGDHGKKEKGDKGKGGGKGKH